MTRISALLRHAFWTHPAPGAPLSLPLHQTTQSRIALRASRSGSRTIQCNAQDTSSEHLRWHPGGGTVHSSATVHATATVEHGALVSAHAHVAAHAHIATGCVVGPNVHIGPSTTLSFNVTLQNCTIGPNCTIHPGVAIGQDGFGFTEKSGEIVKKPQLLGVRIGSHVEIGANSCIDRGSWRETMIGDHTKIDNLVQIGHNAWIGRGCMLCGQVGIAGSATLGDYVVVGGKAGVADHVTVASRVRIAAKSGVMADIDVAGDYAGFPAVPVREWRRQRVILRRMGRRERGEGDER